MGQIAFIALAVVALISALFVVLHKRPIIQALNLVINLLSVAGLYVLMQAYFFAAIQVIVYAGAIVVLITFVIMLLNLEKEWRGGAGLGTLLFAGLLGVCLVALLGKSGWTYTSVAGPETAAGQPGPYGSVAQIGAALFGPYFFPFEVVSLALVAAMIGAVLLAKKNLED
jgi:NADH-quinone oxidoreductase subunit J